MTQEEIIEGNKLIAEFMGGKIVQGEQWEIARFYDTDGEIETAERVLRLKYHTSWDWLMPVVEKIDKVHFSDFNNVNLWVLEEEKRKVLDLPIRTKVHKIWLAVVQLVKWYNQNK